MGKPERERLLGRPKNRWENNINMDIKEWDLGVWSGVMWLKAGTCGMLL